ncbi:MAG: hypothetical protein M5U07_13685 [Xanthobacteraceae bacterium]|nr:hypothetical protein [Xanthobacteraceae bacterium]
MTDPLITLTRDPRLAMHATSAVGAWLWASDASRILWSNAAGAALVGAATPAALAERRFTPDQPLATQIARLAGSLPATGAPRLDRLRGVGGGVGGALLCSCSRLSLAEGGHAVLVVATEVVKPTLPLAERVQRLVAGTDAPVAVYAADGVLMQARGGPLRARLAGPLGELDLTAVAAAALESGQARGASRLGEVALHRLGAGSATVLLAVFAETLPEATVPAAAEGGPPPPPPRRSPRRPQRPRARRPSRPRQPIRPTRSRPGAERRTRRPRRRRSPARPRAHRRNPRPLRPPRPGNPPPK